MDMFKLAILVIVVAVLWLLSDYASKRHRRTKPPPIKGFTLVALKAKNSCLEPEEPDELEQEDEDELEEESEADLVC